MGSAVWNLKLGSEIQDLGLRVWYLGSRIQGLGFGVFLKYSLFAFKLHLDRPL